MQLSSPEFSDGGALPWSASAANENRLPTLDIMGVPRNTQTLALLISDLDSPLGTMTHWLIWNMPPDTHRLSATELPPSHAMGMSGFGKIGYLGPIPPAGAHRYQFTLLALDQSLSLKEGATRQQFERASTGHILEQAHLSATLERPKVRDDSA